MSPSNLIALISFAGIASAVTALLWGIRDAFRRRDPQAELQRQMKRLPTFRDTAPAGLIEKLDLYLERTLYWSGTSMTPMEAALMAVLVAVGVGGAIYVAVENEMLAAIGALGGLVSLAVVLEVRKRKRLKRYELQFPAALDLLARAVRAGESVEQAMAVVGEAMGDPVGPEFQRCARQLELGLSLGACMRALGRRVDQMDTRIFATTLSVHREAGGNLPVTLERLAEVIRDRMSYHRQLRSVTAAGRFSALLIAVVGPLLFAYFFLVQPEYGGRLLHDPLGRWLLVYAVGAELIGLTWIFRMIRSEY